MSLNKIIIGFIVLLLIVSGIVLFQLNKTSPLPKTTVTIDKQDFSVEVATTSAQQQQGLSGRGSMPKNSGMLFIFKTAQKYPFWMKDMKFPLDMIFINDNKIVDIIPNTPAPKNGNDNLPIYTPAAPDNQTLEINAGLAKQYGFKKGDAVKVAPIK
ncbi:MAG TPA: DUF192 domain-containing protein [Candidatus Saccharimonadales bacterium]|nr:DUF192 domain-containing protein [Candidatus Saccharimonadales bacterium]